MSTSNRAKYLPDTGEAGLLAEIDRLTRENVRLRQRGEKSFLYIREKVNQLLKTIGTCPLRPEELDDESLLVLDPIGIINDTFVQILEHLQETNLQLSLTRDEIGAIFHAAGAGILVLDSHRRILSYNRKLQESFLQTQGEVIGCRCSEVICGSAARMSECVFEKVLTSRKGEHRADIRFGDSWYEVIGVPVLTSGGEIVQVVLLYADVTELKKAEAGLRSALAEARDARRKTEGILQSVTDPLIAIDRDHRIVMVNRAAEDLFGFCLFEPFGLALDKVVRDPALLEQIRTVLLGEEPTRLDFTLAGEGRERIFQARTSILRDEGGAPAGTIILIQEVTLERELERMKNELVSTAAHELHTPLTSIIGFAELLLEEGGLSAETGREALQIIHQKAEDLSRIVDDLLDLGRIEAGREIELTISPQDINELIRQVLRSHRLSDRHRLELRLPERPVRVPMDGRRIVQVLENILSNAIKYSPAGGAIRVRGRRQGKNFQVTVADEGIGMTGEQVMRIFERFYRGDVSNTSIGGTGLGMSIAHHIVAAHGGSIWVESEPGRGTEVHFTLPLGKGRPEEAVRKR